MSQTETPQQNRSIRHRFQDLLRDETFLSRLIVPIFIGISLLFTAWFIWRGDVLIAGVSAVVIALFVLIATLKPAQRVLIRAEFGISHAFYLAVFWVYTLLTVSIVRVLLATPSTGKESQPYYILAVLLFAVLFRLCLSLLAIFPFAYRVFMSDIPLWEQIIVAINEFLAAVVLAFVLGGQVAQILQPDVFTLRVDIPYTVGLLFLAGTYYVITQAMWISRWNKLLSRNFVWVQFARIVTPIALVVVTIVIIHHFTSLSEPRSANLLGDANVDETILALSPIIWMMVFFVVFIVYTGNRGLRRRLLPDKLLNLLPNVISNRLKFTSDMDIILFAGMLASVIPLQLFLFDSSLFIGTLQQQLSTDNALIDTSEQALALIFAIPFYLFAVLLLTLYASVMINPALPAKDRDALVERLPLSLLLMFVITLYMAAIPFSQVLSSGDLPQLPQDLGYILAFNVLIPLILLLFHYYLFIRFPYGFGQSRWRKNYALQLEESLRTVDLKIATLQKHIDTREAKWGDRDGIQESYTEQITTLHDLISLNGERDTLNMERLRVVSERQELAEISEAPVSVTIAQLPRQVVSYGIPLVLAFKIYEWAIINDGLREVANNPDIGILEFFATILENTNF